MNTMNTTIEPTPTITNTPPPAANQKPEAALDDAPCSIFELVDVSADEYYTLGLFWSEADAIVEATHGARPPIDSEDYVRMEVRKRRMGFTGWGENGRKVAEIEWSQYLDEGSDEWRWHRPVVNKSNA